MDDLTNVFYICIIIPTILSLFVLERPARLVMGSFIIGMSICLYTSEINSVVYEFIGNTMDYFSTTISPIIEEVAKALPVLALAFLMKDKSAPAQPAGPAAEPAGSSAVTRVDSNSLFRKKLIQVAFAVGLGFAVMENITIITQAATKESFTVVWAVTRGLSAGLLHSVCTMAVGIGASFIRTRKKFFYCGTLALLMLAITYHAIYNTIISSSWRNFGFALPLATYIPILFFWKKRTSRSAGQ